MKNKYDNFKAIDHFEHSKGAAKDFRAILAVVCARLQGVVERTRYVKDQTGNKPTGLVPPRWREKASKKAEVKR